VEEFVDVDKKDTATKLDVLRFSYIFGVKRTVNSG